ncbi:MAG: phosphopantothenoylcysteine decarboxylase, partial [Candidatus Phosphoribacter sp.]
LRVLITAGGTREALDPVRFLGNRSSGKQGYALAEVARDRGAQVCLVSANVTLPDPAGVVVIRVESALDVQQAVASRVTDHDIVVMCAAVADFRPKAYAPTKIKKTHDPTGGPGGADESAPVIELVRNPDILRGLVEARGAATRPIIVGFAAETGDAGGTVLELARAKLARKGCDVLVANEVGRHLTFGQDANTVHLLFADGSPERTIGPATKVKIAEAVWDGIQALGHRSTDSNPID